MQLKVVALRKRTQIAATNRVMFLWVAGVSIVFGFSLVGVIFLTQMAIFNEKVLHEKDVTVATLASNNANIKDLEAKVRVLDTNQALTDSKAKPEDHTVQVILDALPSEANSLALGASLQNKLLNNINNFTIDTLQVDPVIGVETIVEDNAATVVAPTTSSSQYSIALKFSASGDENSIQQALRNLESSIRTINVDSLTIESQGTSRVLTVEGRAFYEPARVVKLKDKTVK